MVVTAGHECTRDLITNKVDYIMEGGHPGAGLNSSERSFNDVQDRIC
jgi:hypothetical protein